jgi:hypothetical protein
VIMGFVKAVATEVENELALKPRVVLVPSVGSSPTWNGVDWANKSQCSGEN